MAGQVLLLVGISIGFSIIFHLQESRSLCSVNRNESNLDKSILWRHTVDFLY